jgi:tRNA pseudouridine55 synthase
VQCSKGTYVRSLAHDVGQRLGCGAHLSGLTRTASGRFHIEQAVALPELEQAFLRGEGPRLILPPDVALQAFPAVALDPILSSKVTCGQHVLLRDEPVGDTARAYGMDGRLLALLQRGGDGLWQPFKVFVGQTTDENHP